MAPLFSGSCEAPPLFHVWRGDTRGSALRVVACLPAETSLADSSKIHSSGTLADPLPHSTLDVPRRHSMVMTSVLSDFTIKSVLSNLTYFASVVEELITISGSVHSFSLCQRDCLPRARGHR